MARSAHLTDEIIQFFRDFDRRETPLNLRVVGSIPTRLTTFLRVLLPVCDLFVPCAPGSRSRPRRVKSVSSKIESSNRSGPCDTEIGGSLRCRIECCARRWDSP